MEKPKKNPFESNPEQVLQERMKYARKVTREEFLNLAKKGKFQKSSDIKK
jgi:hypothetical protein